MYIHKGKLRELRELRGWTQKDVADKISLPDTRTLRRWESGEAIPSPRYRAKLCDIFEIDLEKLGFISEHHRQLEISREDPFVQQADSSELVVPTAPTHFQLLTQFDKLSTSSDHWNRQRLLEKVRAFWIKEVLEHSLYENTRITLELREQPDAVTNPWKQAVRLPRQARPFSPRAAPIIQVYDDACGELLILGAPGAGKTTLLLELTQELLLRANENDHHPIPVVFNLSSWSMQGLPFSAWLIEELSCKYQVPQRVGHAWVENDHILPLLDSLDEVNLLLRGACVETINAYRQTHGLLPMVICSRKDEYLNMTTHLLLQKAICIQPLTQERIDEYLITLRRRLCC